MTGARILAIAALTACAGSDVAAPAAAPAPVTAAETAGAAPAAQHADPFRRLSRVPGSTFIEILEVRAREDGTLLYCTAVRGLQVVDATVPAAMTTVAQLRSSLGHEKFGRCQHLSWEGDIVYATNRGDRIQPTPYIAAFDLSDTDSGEIATYKKEGVTFEGIAATGGYQYVAMHDHGLAVLQRTGRTFREVATLRDIGTAWAIAVDGDHAYVTDAGGKLVIVNIADPSRPAVTAMVDIGGTPQSVEIRNHVAFVAAGTAGWAAVDVSDPAKPKVIANVDTPGSALQVALADGRMYLADWNEVRIYDVEDPSAPVLLTAENIDTGKPSSRILGIGARDNIAFVGEWTGMYAYELSPQVRAPEISVSVPSVEMGRVAPGDSRTDTIELDNDGPEPLIISAITTTSPTVSVNRNELTIAPGATAMLEIKFTAADSEQMDGAIVLHSNDPDEPLRQVPITGNRKGVSTGDPAPALALSLVGGGEWKLADHRGEVVVLAYFATF